MAIIEAGNSNYFNETSKKRGFLNGIAAWSVTKIQNFEKICIKSAELNKASFITPNLPKKRSQLD